MLLYEIGKYLARQSLSEIDVIINLGMLFLSLAYFIFHICFVLLSCLLEIFFAGRRITSTQTRFQTRTEFLESWVFIITIFFQFKI